MRLRAPHERYETAARGWAFAFVHSRLMPLLKWRWEAVSLLAAAMLATGCGREASTPTEPEHMPPRDFPSLLEQMPYITTNRLADRVAVFAMVLTNARRMAEVESTNPHNGKETQQAWKDWWPEFLLVNVDADKQADKEPQLRRKKALDTIDAIGKAGLDDAAVSNCLSWVIWRKSDPIQPNSFDVEFINRAVAVAVTQEKGRQGLLAILTQDNYRSNPSRFKAVIEAIGLSRTEDTNVASALAQAAVRMTTTNGAFYESCTKSAVRSLLQMGNTGQAALIGMLTKENAARLEDVVTTIDEAKAYDPRIMEALRHLAQEAKGWESLQRAIESVLAKSGEQRNGG